MAPKTHCLLLKKYKYFYGLLQNDQWQCGSQRCAWRVCVSYLGGFGVVRGRGHGDAHRAERRIVSFALARAVENAAEKAPAKDGLLRAAEAHHGIHHGHLDGCKGGRAKERKNCICFEMRTECKLGSMKIVTG